MGSKFGESPCPFWSFGVCWGESPCPFWSFRVCWHEEETIVPLLRVFRYVSHFWNPTKPPLDSRFQHQILSVWISLKRLAPWSNLGEILILKDSYVFNGSRLSLSPPQKWFWCHRWQTFVGPERYPSHLILGHMALANYWIGCSQIWWFNAHFWLCKFQILDCGNTLSLNQYLHSQSGEGYLQTQSPKMVRNCGGASEAPTNSWTRR